MTVKEERALQKIGNRRQIALKRAISTAQNPIIPSPFFDDSWRGPDTQRGRFVPYLEKECGGRKGLGMDPAKFEVLADWCSMGHLPSMRRMRQHFESRISPEARRRLEDYLSNEAETLFDWDDWLEARPDDCFNVRASAFWLCRLAEFGDEAARAALEAQPRLGTMAFMKLHPVRGHSNWQAWYSPAAQSVSGLARLGLLDLAWDGGHMPASKVTDCIFMAEDFAGDSGRDETGFGMEEEYDFYYFEEYNRLLKVLYGWSNHDMRVNEERIRGECLAKKAAFEAERRAFMVLHASDGAPC